jgi:fucose permease
MSERAHSVAWLFASRMIVRSGDGRLGPMSRSSSTGPLVAIAFALFIVLGLSIGVTGVAWPSMRSDFSRPLADLGVLLAVGTAGYFLAGLVAGRLTRRLGIGRTLLVILVVGSGCLAGYAVAAAWPFLLGCSIGVGFAGGTIDSVMNAYVALRHDTRTMNLLHAFFGIGATTGPVLVAAVLARGLRWQTAYFVLAGVELMLLGAVVIVRGRWPGPAALSTFTEGQHNRLGESVFALLGMFFLYVGIEITAGQWAYSVLTEGRGLGELAAGVWVAVYWGGLTAGRLTLGVVGNRVASRSVLRLSMIGSTVGSILFWLDPVDIGVAGLLVLGFSLAGIFPTLVAMTPSWVGEEKAETVIGYQIAAASAGTALMPWLAGRVISAAGLESLGPYLLALVLIMAGLNWFIDTRASGQTRAVQKRSLFSRATRHTNSSQS